MTHLNTFLQANLLAGLSRSYMGSCLSSSSLSSCQISKWPVTQPLINFRLCCQLSGNVLDDIQLKEDDFSHQDNHQEDQDDILQVPRYFLMTIFGRPKPVLYGQLSVCLSSVCRLSVCRLSCQISKWPLASQPTSQAASIRDDSYLLTASFVIKAGHQ